MSLEYEYHCRSNGKSLLVRHGMNEKVRTWSELCHRAGVEDCSAEPEAKVERIIYGGVLALERRVSKEAPRTDLDAILRSSEDSCLPCCATKTTSQE